MALSPTTFEIAADPVPLEKWQDGSIRVSGTRLHYYLFLQFYKGGDGPHDLLEAFPFLSLGTIHVLIGYYLHHQRELDDWLARIEQEIEEIEKSYPRDPGLKDRLLARMAERKASASDRP